MRAASALGPAHAMSAVNPSDDADLPRGPTRGLFVGGAGDLVIRDAEGSEVVLVSGAAQYHPISIVRVLASGTTATGIVALY
jgi:hypothetical protein